MFFWNYADGLDEPKSFVSLEGMEDAPEYEVYNTY